jgi:hypothetical protein
MSVQKGRYRQEETEKRVQDEVYRKGVQNGVYRKEGTERRLQKREYRIKCAERRVLDGVNRKRGYRMETYL